MEFKNIKIVVFVPLSHCENIRQIIGDMNGGVIGNYSYCSFSSKGIGRFKPNQEANPYIGKSAILEEVEEEKIEFICPKNTAKKIIDAIKCAHPYEEVAFDIYPLLDESDII